MKKVTKKKKKKTSYGNPSQTTLDWYYAGIIDGEGCLAITRSKGKHNPIYNTVICVGMVNKYIVDALQDRFGGTVRKECVHNRQDIYRWKLQAKASVRRAAGILEDKLNEKHRQLANIKDFLDNRIENPNHRRYLDPRELQRRQGLYLKSRELNAVGVGATTKRFNSREAEAIV